jgi:hypothetical protein
MYSYQCMYIIGTPDVWPWTFLFLHTSECFAIHPLRATKLQLSRRRRALNGGAETGRPDVPLSTPLKVAAATTTLVRPRAGGTAAGMAAAGAAAGKAARGWAQVAAATAATKTRKQRAGPRARSTCRCPGSWTGAAAAATT